MVSVLLLGTLGTLPTLSEAAVDPLLAFFSTAATEDRISAQGVYLVARCLCESDPLRSYQLTLEAFRFYPRLSEIYGIDYTYDPAVTRESLTEHCPVCGDTGPTPYYCVPQIFVSKTDPRFSPAKLWLHCQNCQTLFAYNFPLSQMGEINGHYTKGTALRSIEPTRQLSVYGNIFNRAREFTRGLEYLEVGVGNGEMLAVAMEMGYSVSAVEICKQDCENLSGLLGVDIVWSDFLEYESNRQFDLIVMGDVLEHTGQPLLALEKAAAMLSKGGVLWLSTPNYNSGFSRLRGFADPMWNQKNHYTYFCLEGLTAVLETLGLGVVRYDVSERYNGSMELFIMKTDR